MLSLTSDVFTHFSITIDDLWGVCKTVDEQLTHYYTDKGLDYAGIRLLQLLPKTRKLLIWKTYTQQSIKIKCVSPLITNALYEQLLEKKYNESSVMVLAYYMVMHNHTIDPEHINYYSFANAVYFVQKIENNTLDLIAFDDPDFTKYKRLGEFAIRIYNTFNHMIGQSKRYKIISCVYGCICTQCNTISVMVKHSINGCNVLRRGSYVCRTSMEEYNINDQNWFYGLSVA